nr:hypothetical protein [Candidatus Bipolaricaulis sp.]
MKNKQPTQEQQSRSVQRRIAAQKGKPAPDFSKPMTEEKLRKQIANYLTKQFVFLPEELPEDECLEEADRILSLIKQPEVIDMLARKAGYTQLDADQQTPQYNNDFLSQF